MSLRLISSFATPATVILTGHDAVKGGEIRYVN